MPLLRGKLRYPGGIQARGIVTSKGQGGHLMLGLVAFDKMPLCRSGKGDEQFTYSKWFDESLQDLSATDMLMNTIAYMKAKSP